jgi:hypothetical protein
MEKKIQFTFLSASKNEIDIRMSPYEPIIDALKVVAEVEKIPVEVIRFFSNLCDILYFSLSQNITLVRRGRKLNFNNNETPWKLRICNGSCVYCALPLEHY